MRNRGSREINRQALHSPPLLLDYGALLEYCNKVEL
jgi:hypothetical protein